MKYYVITPTTNLSNILASETISPAGLYQKRSSGFRSLDRFDDDECVDAIRLYDKCPAFRADEPSIVLELDKKIVRCCQKDAFCSLWTTETIYLEPNASVKLLFRSEEECNEAFASVRKSIEAKFADAYRLRASVPKDVSKETEPFTSADDSHIEGSYNVESFEYLDRIKGAIFCFRLGEALSVAEPGNDSTNRDLFLGYMQTVERLVNAIPFTPTDELGREKTELERILFTFSCKAELSALKTAEKSETFNLGVALEHLEDQSEVKLSSDLAYSTTRLNQFRSNLEGRAYSFKGLWAKKRRTNPRYEEGEIVLPKADLASALVNAMAQKNFLRAASGGLRYPFALKCGETVRGFMNEQWADSAERCYVNSLLTHLNEGKALDNASIEHIDGQTRNALQAMSYLSMREENKDLDSFYRFLLIKCDVTDFGIPFAMWGATFGFSALPKSLCGLLDDASIMASRNLFKEVLKDQLPAR